MWGTVYLRGATGPQKEGLVYVDRKDACGAFCEVSGACWYAPSISIPLSLSIPLPCPVHLEGRPSVLFLAVA